MNSSELSSFESTFASRHEPPDSFHSVGMTFPKSVTLTAAGQPFELESGKTLDCLEVEYETYGELSPDCDNAILVCHALTGDAHAAGWDSTAVQYGRQWRTSRPGWWDRLIGPGKSLDTNRFFIICANVIGSCYGTTGPYSTNPATGHRYGLDFPMVTIGDWVRMEACLLDRLGIRQLYAIVGGSLGGQQALEFALAYPERVLKCIILASGPKLPSQGLAFNAVARHAILHDSHFNGGDYYGNEKRPGSGLAVARMLAHITYLSDKGLERKFGRRWQESDGNQSGFGVEFAVESYLEHQGKSFVARFDANSYLYMTRAMDYYDAAGKWGEGDLVRACKRVRAEMMVVTFSSDWLYPPDVCETFVSALLKNRIPVTYVNVESLYGHDAFLVEHEKVGRLLRAFLLSSLSSRRWKSKGGGGIE